MKKILKKIRRLCCNIYFISLLTALLALPIALVTAKSERDKIIFAEVVQCEDAGMEPNLANYTISQYYANQGDYTMANTYWHMSANPIYIITIEIDGKEYQVIRNRSYKVGEKISVEKDELLE